MRPAIVSAGPSAALYSKDNFQDRFVIAVNRAAFLVKPHWIVAGDAETVIELYEAKRPPIAGICTLSASVDRILSACPFWKSFKVITWGTLPGHGLHWCRKHEAEGYSLTAAACLCAHFGHRTADLFGHDAVPGPGCIGDVPPTADRGADRWRRESNELSAACTAAGITLYRHHPSQPTTTIPG